MFRFTTIPLLFTTAFILCHPQTIWANAGPPFIKGQTVGDPIGVIKNIYIEKEDLNIDLRAASERGPAKVHVEYHLHNKGNEQKIDLSFVLGSENAQSFRVWLNDTPIPVGNLTKAEQLPESWKVPQETPQISGERPYMYGNNSRQGIIPFQVTIPSGNSILRMEYAAKMGTYLASHPLISHQFVYILAPAKAWAGVGQLDVTIQIPQDWEYAATPKMTRQGDQLQGSFSGIPADRIAISISATVPNSYETLWTISVGLFAGVGLLGVPICFFFGRSRGKCTTNPEGKRHGIGVTIMFSAIAAALYSALVAAAGILAMTMPTWVLPANQVSDYGYGTIFAIIGIVFLGILLLPIGYLAYFAPAMINRGK